MARNVCRIRPESLVSWLLVSRWKAVADYLKREVVARMAEPALGEAWIRALAANLDGRLLGVSLAIDIRSGSLEGRTFAGVLDRLDASQQEARSGFAVALGRTPRRNDLLCQSAYRASSKDFKCRYLRVLSLEDFIVYYAGPTFGYTLDSDDVRQVREAFFLKSKRTLEDIDRWWAGSLPVVWVTSQPHLARFMKSYPRALRATTLNDALGLGRPKGTELVMIHYPSGFDASVACAQPTTLDSAWTSPGSYYLSAQSRDAWGRTASCSGRAPAMRERVHSHFKNLTDAYYGTYVGVVTKVTTKRSHLLHEAYARFSQGSR
jgi:hypothetical protein